MDNINEKKWFVYLGDHHEGPFSLGEISSKIQSGVGITSANFVWCDGMADWKLMTEVDAFAQILNKVADSEPTFSSVNIDTQSSAQDTPQPQIILSPMEKDTEEVKESVSETSEEVASVEPSKNAFSRGVRLLGIMAVPVGLFYLTVSGVLDPLLDSGPMQGVANSLRPTMITLMEKIPAISGMFSPLPVLPGLEVGDYEEMKVAALASPTSPGRKLAVAASLTDTTSPEVYVAGNLPDGTEIEVVVEGVPDSLLNQTSFTGTAKVILKSRWGKSEAIRGTDGKSAPKGRFRVYAYDAKDQSSAQASSAVGMYTVSTDKTWEKAPAGRRLTAVKYYFLGGKNDEDYKSRLKQYHDSLRAKVLKELEEIKQLTKTLEGQLEASVTQFQASRSKKGKPSKNQLKTWEDAHSKWVKMFSQLQESFKTWTPESLEKERFYGALYLRVTLYAQSIEKIHGLHNGYFADKADPAALDAQVAAETQNAVKIFTDLTTKTSQAEMQANNPVGLPKRESQ